MYIHTFAHLTLNHKIQVAILSLYFRWGAITTHMYIATYVRTYIRTRIAGLNPENAAGEQIEALQNVGDKHNTIIVHGYSILFSQT